MTPEQKELIEEKFKGVHLLIESGFDALNKDIVYIKEQVTKTNGRVTKLEEWRWKIIGISIGVSAVIGFAIKIVL